MARRVEIHPYDPAWPEVYLAEVEEIALLLSSNLLAAHHIGSTAVPGLAAKPTIDILLVVRNLDELDASSAAMQARGYTPKGENGITGRRYFQKMDGDVHRVHIHAFKAGHPDIQRHLNFRDYLIAHPQIAHDYQVLKLDLAVQFRDAPADYTAGKSEFIRCVAARAAEWRAQHNQPKGDQE